VRQQPTASRDALGRSINQPAAKLQNARLAVKAFASRSPEKIRFHLGGHRRVRHSEFRLNRKPLRNVGGSHKYVAAHKPSRTFESFLKGYFNTARAVCNTIEPQTKIPREGYFL
jgi:hypothetical protein